MSKRQNNSIIVGIGAMLALVVSLPLEWMTIHDAQVQVTEGFQNVRGLGTMTIELTGFNGKITLLTELPIWLIVLVGLVGVLLAFLNHLRITSLSNLVSLILLSLSALPVIGALIVTIASSEATLGVGVFIALLGLALGFTLIGRKIPRGQPGLMPQEFDRNEIGGRSCALRHSKMSRLFAGERWYVKAET